MDSFTMSSSITVMKRRQHDCKLSPDLCDGETQRMFKTSVKQMLLMVGMNMETGCQAVNLEVLTYSYTLFL